MMFSFYFWRVESAMDWSEQIILVGIARVALQAISKFRILQTIR